MSEDIIKRLRDLDSDPGGSYFVGDICEKAIEEIERLRAALRPFADGCRTIKSRLPVPHGLGYHNTFTMLDLERAAELIPPISQPPSAPAAPGTTS